MTGYSYDAMRYEAQQHFNRLADEAAAERLARQARGESNSEPVDGIRWLSRLQHVWTSRVIHAGEHASIARAA
jgi:hypothetical protein